MTDDDRDPVEASISQVLKEVPRYLHFDELGVSGPTWQWQWHVALAKEFIRQGSRSGTVPPLAVLALATAANHLTFATQIIDRLHYGTSRDEAGCIGG